MSASLESSYTGPSGSQTPTLSPLAGPGERSAYDMLMTLAGGDGSPVGPGAGMPTGAPSTGNFGRDAMGFGRATGQAALGMMANPASIPGSVIGTMAAAGLRGLTSQPNPVNVTNALGMRGLANAIGYAARGPSPVETAFGAQDGSKPGALSAQEVQAQMANAMATNDMGGPKSGWGADGGGGGYGTNDSVGTGSSTDAGGTPGASGGSGAASGGGPGAADGGASSDSSDNWASGGLIPFAEGGHIVQGPGGGLDDLIPTTINGRRAAALSDGEFVIPADVVSMMGDGSTNAGAKRLYDFMQTIRQHKTGTAEQAGPLPIGDILKRSMR